jgi:hypothetical protein
MKLNTITQEMRDNSVWCPNEGSQSLYLACSDIVFEGSKTASYNVILYHGGRAIGKSEVILADFAKGVGVGYGGYWYGVIFRKTVPELRDIVNKAQKFFIDSGAFPGAKLVKSPEKKITFANGEQLLFMHMFNENDYDKHHGLEYSFIGFEELTLWSSQDVMTNMRSCLRLQDSYNKKFEKDIQDGKKQKMVGKIRATTNPYGSGKTWVKKAFIDKAKAGEFFLHNNTTTLHIKGHYSENKYIQASYVEAFNDIVNKEKKAAWVHGDWNRAVGGAFGDLWIPDQLILEPFEIPINWYVDRSMDWGTSSPFSILYFAETDGNSVFLGSDNSLNGKREFCPPKGSLIVIGEFYGKSENEIRANVGLNLTPYEVVNGMGGVENRLINDTIISKQTKIHSGPADSAISSNTAGLNAKTILDMFEDEKCYWETPAKPTRASGVVLLQNYMKATISEDNDKPHIYFFDTCKFIIENLPILQYDSKKPDDIDTTQEDHDYDALRYRLHHQRATTVNTTIEQSARMNRRRRR